MSKSMSIGNQIHRQELAIAGSTLYTKEMPKEAGVAGGSLKRAVVRIRDLAASQERAKQQLATTTQQLNNALAEGNRLTAQIVRLAEATWGPRHPRLREFRPATEGQATKRAFTRRKTQEMPATPTPVAVVHN